MLFGDRKKTSLNKEVLNKIANDERNSNDPYDVSYTDFQRQFARFYLRYKQITQVLQGSTLPLLKHLKVFRCSVPVLADHATATGTLDENDNADVRVQCEFIQMASYSGRISTRNPNLQCLSTSHGVRHLISVRGCGGILRPITTETSARMTRRRKILAADYSQIELRIIASLSQDERLCAVLNQQVDVHRRIAALLYRVKVESSVTTVQRQKAKQVVYSILYGASALGIARQVGVSMGEARRLRNEFFRLFPNVDKFIHETVELGSTTGYVTTVTGRRIMTNVNKIESNKSVIMNMPIQATQADMIKLAMTRIHTRLQQHQSQREANQAKSDCRLILQLHDELVFEVGEDEVEDVTKIVLDSMIQALPLNGVQIAVKIGVGDTWQEASESAQLRVV